MSKQAKSEFTYQVAMLTSSWSDALQPTCDVKAPRGTSYRKIHATALVLAAKIELATPEVEGWVVQVGVDGRIWIECATDKACEAQRALAVIKAVVAGL